MKLTEDKQKEYIKKILLSRFRILNNYGFYGLMLMHMKFGIDEKAPTAYTDGHKICFGPKFLESLSDSEMDFIMMHEILHVALKHCFRGRIYDQDKFNIACDIVVNSNILYSNNMNLNSISLKGYGPSMHLTPKGQEGYLYTAEEVYKMLPDKPKGKPIIDLSGSGVDPDSGLIDDHTHWIEGEDEDFLEDEWEERMLQASEALQIKESSKNRGTIPLGILRQIKDLKDSTIDWRNLLLDFITFEIADYSFAPPDRRFDDSSFFLPDFNEPEEKIELNILFEIDTSGSMSDDDITSAFSEIKGAIEYGDGKLTGWLGFYDGRAYDPEPFDSVEDVLKIKPKGGGGTCCKAVFDSLNHFENIIGNIPDAIIFLTDGYDEFPNEEARKNIPVFWIITGDNPKLPPWGVVAKIKKNKEKEE